MKRSANARRRQKGLSTPGMIMVVGIFGLLVVTFFKVFPMYYGNFKLKAALTAISQDGEINPKSKRDIWESLQKRLFVDEVRDIKRNHVVMERKNGKTTITVTYETRDNYIGNLFIGASFVESVVIDR